MNKKNKHSLVRLVSTANTGHFYTTRVSRKMTTKLKLKKLDPTIRQRVFYVEKKIK